MRRLALCVVVFLTVIPILLIFVLQARAQYAMTIHSGGEPEQVFLVSHIKQMVYILRHDEASDTYYWELMEFRRAKSDLRSFWPLTIIKGSGSKFDDLRIFQPTEDELFEREQELENQQNPAARSEVSGGQTE